MRVSNTQITMYNECGMKYYYKYIERLRSPEIPTPFLFGGALDETFNYILECKKDNKPVNKDEAIQLFEKEMTYFRGGESSIIDDPNVTYFNSDVALHLLDESSIAYFSRIDPEFESACASSLKVQGQYVKWFKEHHSKHYPRLGWYSLYQKGLMFINTYIDEILPLIDEVEEIQDTRIVLNDDDDELIFITDFLAYVYGHRLLGEPFDVPDDIKSRIEPDKKYLIVFDNKTSSMPYELHAVRESVQLSTYSEFYDTNLAGYIVLNKKIGKKKKVNWQVIVDFICPDFQAEHFNNIQETMSNIKAGHFPKNFNACFSYGKKCDYTSICKYGEMGKLYKKEK